MARKYTVKALCRRCKTTSVGTLASDHEYFADKTEYVDAFHVCPPCAPLDAADRQREIDIEVERKKQEEVARLASTLGVTVEQFQRIVKKLSGG